MPPKPKPNAAADDKHHSHSSSSARPRRSFATEPVHDESSVSEHDGEPTTTSKKYTKFTASRLTPRGSSPSRASAALARGGVVSDEVWHQNKDWESEYPDEVPSPTSSDSDPRARISDEVKRWFSTKYLDTFISHFRRNTDVAIGKRSDWLKRIKAKTGPFAGHDVNLTPDSKDPTIMKYFGYFNYMDYPELGVSDAEMVEKIHPAPESRSPKLLILIGGASVGKTSIKPYFVQNATDVDVDEPVMYADAMFEMMPEKKEMWGKGKGINQRYIIYAVVDRLIRNRDDIIIDSTGGSKMAIHYSMNKAIKAGYQIICAAVWAPLVDATTRCNTRTATTMRKMSGHGVKFTFVGAVEGKYIEHYALKPRFRNKIDLFFLIDNTSRPTPELVSIAEAETIKHREVLGDIKIPPTTVLVIKNHHNPDKTHLRSDLIYRTPHPNHDIASINFYGCHVHLPPHSPDPIPNITPNDIIQCRYPPSSAKKGGRRTRKILKIQKSRRHHKSLNTHTRHTRHIRHTRHRDVQQTKYTRRR